jgi:hypothetical protein
LPLIPALEVALAALVKGRCVFVAADAQSFIHPSASNSH